MPARLVLPLLLPMLVMPAAESRAQETISIARLHESAKQGDTTVIRGVVTCVANKELFVQDGSAATAVTITTPVDVSAGDEVQVTGKVRRLATGSVVEMDKIERLGASTLPEPEITSIATLFGGHARWQRVRVTTAVHDVAIVGGEVRLQIPIGSIASEARWRFLSMKRPDELLDAVVELTGVAVPYVRPDGVIGITYLQLRGVDDVKVIQLGDTEVFRKPERKVNSLRSEPPPAGERVRVTGVVTHVAPGNWYYLQDETGPLRAVKPVARDLNVTNRRATFNSPLALGDRVDVVGQPYLHAHADGAASKFLPWLLQCDWRLISHGEPPAYQRVHASAVFDGDFDGRCVSVVGRVADMQVWSNKEGGVDHLVTLDDGRYRFYLLLQAPRRLSGLVKVGSDVQADGVVTVLDKTPQGRTLSFRVNLAAASSVRSVDKLWRLSDLLPWVLGITGAALTALAWVILLRRQVRKQTARVLEANTALSRFKAIADATTDLIGMTTLDRRVLYLNAAGRTMVGLAEDTPVEEISFASLYTPETMELFERDAFAQALQTGAWSGEVTMCHTDGREIPVSFVGMVVKSEDGTPQHLACIARDITAHREQERRLLATLDHERELNQMKSSFVNTISHEFRTPLGIIMFASGLLHRLDSKLEASERDEQFHAIDEAVGRMNDLVEQALSLGRAETTGPRLETAGIETLCRRLADEVQSSTAHRSPIIIKVPSPLPPAHTDVTMMRTIVGNLVSNAIKYSPAGSPVEVLLQREGDHLVIRVRDHGPGLCSDDLPHLFSMFYRGSNVTGTPGTGLGLAIVKRCAEVLGGSVRASNALDGGAIFEVTLPLATAGSSVSNPPT